MKWILQDSHIAAMLEVVRAIAFGQQIILVWPADEWYKKWVEKYLEPELLDGPKLIDMLNQRLFVFSEKDGRSMVKLELSLFLAELIVSGAIVGIAVGSLPLEVRNDWTYAVFDRTVFGV